MSRLSGPSRNEVSAGDGGFGDEAAQRQAVELRRLARAMRTINGCMHRLVRAETEAELLRDVCRVMVAEGGYRMAWVGIAEQDGAKTVRPAAAAGYEEGYLEKAAITWADEPRGRGPVGTCIRTGRASVCRNVFEDPDFAPWREDAVKRGYGSLAVMPLAERGEVFGALGIYAAEVDAFDEQEQGLLRDLANDLAYGMVTLRTRDEKRRAVAQLQEREEELQLRNALLSAQQENSIDGILLVDENARILSYNRRFIELWRLPAALVDARIDEPVLQHVTAQQADPAAFLQRVRYLYEHRQETSRDELVLADGRFIDRYSAPIFGAERRYYGRVWYFRDITDRKKLETQFLQSQKFEAFGQLAGGVAHDFNNILAAMLMQVNILQMEPNLTEPLAGGLAELARQAERGAALTRQLLLFSRRQELEVRTLDLNEVLGGVCKMLRRLIGEDIMFELNLVEGPVVVRADAGMIEQVVMNLCVNARDAMPRGGRLAIESRREDPRGGSPPGRFACVVVRDNGCGMDEAVKARIFEPFFTTKPIGQGTGLGLATVYGIMQQHHGCVEVDSAPGGGSSFRAYFPLADGATAPKGSRPDNLRGGHESVLLVEDDDTVRAMVATCLRRAGYRVVPAANGPEARRIWEERGRDFDLLFTDFLMPEGVNGMQLAEQLLAAKPSLRVVVASGYHPGLGASAKPWHSQLEQLDKPFELATLLHTVRRVLDAGKKDG